VSRRDLEDSEWSDPGSSSDDDTTLRDVASQNLPVLEFEFVDTTELEVETIQDEIEFRLFSGVNIDAPNLIKIKSPELSDHPPGFVIPSRPRTYYFKDDLSQQEKDSFLTSALSGEDVIARSRSQWPGCALPWRVITTTQIGKVSVALNAQTITQGGTKKSKNPRIGKKARITKRKKLTANLERKLKMESSLKEKEAALKDKKTKKNRAQKLKRREKERAKKAALRDEEQSSPIPDTAPT
jgi:Fungal protein of unknown function (DUF2011)